MLTVSQLSRFARTRAGRYLVAVLASAVALAVRLLFDPVLGDSIPYATFFLSVALSTVAGGLGPGILATAIGALSALYFFLPPRHQPSAIYGADNQLGFVLYLIVSAMLILLAETQRAARFQAGRESARREHAEAEKLEQYQRFEITLASIGDGVIATDAQAHVTFMNSMACVLTGWAHDEALGLPIDTVFVIRSEETDGAVENPATRAMREGKVVGLANHTILIARSGKRVAIGDSGAPIVDPSGQLRGSVLVFRDVSERRARDAELRQLKRMVDLSQDSIIVTDPQRRIVSWNLGAKEVYGWESAEALGKVIHQLLQTPVEAFERKERALRQDGWWEGELRHVHKGGHEIVCESRQVLLQDSSGNIEGMLEINRDITERKRIERKLLESAKLESLGVLAGGIAHDFNNLLTGVIGNAYLLLDELPLGSAPWSFAKGISEAADRAAKLSQQMLAYSGRGRFVIEPVNLSEHIRQNSGLLQSSIPKNVDLVLELAEDLPLVEADASQLEQLVLNLVVNAAEAIGPQKGRVRVATGSHQVDEAYLRTLLLHDHARPGLHSVIEVSDTGCGMDEQTLARIFDPFFTTKFVGRGLGLAAVQGIVRGHRGAIEVYSRIGEGTTFRVLLPASVTAQARAPRAIEVEPGVEPGKILVIDDEEVVRSTAEAALRRLGYDVVTAASGSQGLELFRVMSDSVRLILLDLSMPGMSGEETMRQLQGIRADIPVVLSSGYSKDTALRHFKYHQLAGFLQKPYTGRTLAMRVREAIGRAAGTRTDWRPTRDGA